MKKKKTLEKNQSQKSETERKINIYEIILNEKPNIPISSIKLTQNAIRNYSDSINDENLEGNNVLKSTRQKNTDSQNLLTDISHRELLEDPKELSFNKEGLQREETENLRNQKESVFSNQKSGDEKSKIQGDLNMIETRINNGFKEKNCTGNELKMEMKNNAENKEIEENEELEIKINKHFKESFRNKFEAENKEVIVSKGQNHIEDQPKFNENISQEKPKNAKSNVGTTIRVKKDFNIKDIEKMIKNQEDPSKCDGQAGDLEDFASDIKIKNQEDPNEQDGQKQAGDLENFASDIKKIMNNVQIAIDKVEVERKNADKNTFQNDRNMNSSKEEFQSKNDPENPMPSEKKLLNPEINSPLDLKASSITTSENLIKSSKNVSTINPVYLDILEQKHQIICPKSTKGTINKILKNSLHKSSKSQTKSETGM